MKTFKSLLAITLAVIVYVSGTDTLTAHVTNIAPITSMIFTLDGVMLGTGTVAPGDPTVYVFMWNTKTTTDGNHVIVGTATDSDGNVGSDTVNVVVQNHPKVKVENQ